MDLIASLSCHNCHTSEKRLKEMMDKSHKAIEDVFSTKALSASECKTENFDKIDTCMEHLSKCFLCLARSEYRILLFLLAMACGVELIGC